MNWKIVYYNEKVQSILNAWPVGLCPDHRANLDFWSKFGNAFYTSVGEWFIRDTSKRQRRNWMCVFLYGCCSKGDCAPRLYQKV